MANQLFHLAEQSVQRAETQTKSVLTPEEHEQARSNIEVAKNDLSSAFANSSVAEKSQLGDLQERLEKCEQYVDNFHEKATI